MFLLNQSSAYQVNEQDSFCFLFPTELLFEGFIGGYIKNALTGSASVKFLIGLLYYQETNQLKIVKSLNLFCKE